MKNKENEAPAGMADGTPKDTNDLTELHASKAKTGEQIFLDSLLEFTRWAKESPVPELAVAARRWEGVIEFRIKLTLQDRERRKRTRDRLGLNKPCRSTGLTRRGQQ